MAIGPRPGSPRLRKTRLEIPGGGTWGPGSTTDTMRWVTRLDDLWPGSEIQVRVIWSTLSTTTTDSVTWRVRYANVTYDSGALAGATLSALDSTISADNAVGTASAVLKSPIGRIYPKNVSPDKEVMFELNASAVSGIDLGEGQADNVQVYGIELAYARSASGRAY